MKKKHSHRPRLSSVSDFHPLFMGWNILEVSSENKQVVHLLKAELIIEVLLALSCQWGRGSSWGIEGFAQKEIWLKKGEVARIGFDTIGKYSQGMRRG